WLDGDIQFLNDEWIEQALSALDSYPLAQLFDRVVNGGAASLGMVAYRSLTGQKKGRTVRRAGTMECFGRSGYAWAARREVLDQTGFYDRCIVGGGDAVMGCA